MVTVTTFLPALRNAARGLPAGLRLELKFQFRLEGKTARAGSQEHNIVDCGSVTGVKNLAGHARPLQQLFAGGVVRFFSNRGRIGLPLSRGDAEETLVAHLDDAFHSRERAQFGDAIGCGKHEDCV